MLSRHSPVSMHESDRHGQPLRGGRLPHDLPPPHSRISPTSRYALHLSHRLAVAHNRRMDRPEPDDVERAGSLLGARPIGWQHMPRGYTAAARWLVTLEDGRRAFIKKATGIDSAVWLRAEWDIYSRIEARFMARVLAWEDGPHPMLALEDLSRAYWPPPWRNGMVESVLDTLDQVAKLTPPPGLPALKEQIPSAEGWEQVASDPAPFLRLGLCSTSWLEAALPALIAAEESAPLAGDALVHCDVRSDNLCLDGDRVVLVDWNWACIGNPKVDVAGWLPSLHAEGGPRPENILPDEPGLAAWLSGLWASQAGLPEPFAGARIREVQLRQLRVALPWVTSSLGLPAPGASGGDGHG